MRFVAALLTGSTLALTGGLVLGAAGSGSVGWLALVLAAMFAASLVDPEHFYGA